MKIIKQFFEALLDLVNLIITVLFTLVRWTWRKFRGWWSRRKTWAKVALVILFIFILFGDVGIWRIKRIFNPSYWDTQLTDYTSVHHFYNDKCRLYDDFNEKYITPKYKWISPVLDNEDYDDTLTVFCDKNNKRGYLNAYTGEVVIEPQYDAAWVFSDGLAAVKKDNMIGFINKDGELVIPFKFKHNKREYDYDYIDYVFHNGYCYMIGNNGYQGVINKSGEWCIEPNYYHISRDWRYNGFRTYSEEALQGYINKDLDVIFPDEYYNIDITSDGYILTKDNRMWKEDFDGNVTIPFMFEFMNNMDYVVGYDNDGNEIYKLSDTYKYYYVADLCGIYNVKTQEVVTPAIYTDVDMLGEDMFEAEINDSGSFVFIPQQ